MRARLFEDLVVSAPPAGRFGRHASVFPLSIAAHGAALALALLFPVLRTNDLPTPAERIDVWRVPTQPTPPPLMATPRPPDVSRTAPPAPVSAPTSVTEAVAPPPAPGPAVSAIEPEGLPPDDARTPCLFNCGAQPSGSGDGPSGAPSGDGVPDGTGTVPIRPGGDIKPPVRTAYVAPIYPDIARAARVSGTVVVECTIDPSGRVVEARVVTGHPLLDESALDAVRQWRYEPTRLNRVPVAVLMTVTVRFIAHR
jgi:protein TonB